MSPQTRQARRRPTAKPIEQHRDWLQLIDAEGPFLTVPVVKAEWPNGMDRLAAGDPRHLRFVDNFNDWRAKPEAQHETWIKSVLSDTAEWGEYLVSGTELPGRLAVDVPEQRTTIRPWGALFAPDADVNVDLPAALVFTAPPGTPLRAPSDTAWAASAVDRAAYALRATGVAVAVVTDGRWWALVSADATRSTASGVVDATLWREEDLLRDAFLSLINARRLIAGPDEQRLPALFERSLLQQEEVTEALGTQVRRAVELLVQAMSEAKVEAQRAGRPDPLEGPPAVAYEIAVTVMMRIVFLLFAEERGMLPLDRDLYRTSYAISPLLDELDIRARDGEEDLANSSLTWYRLLATSSAIFEGASFEDLRMPAYGGSLFDPSRFPALVARNDDGSLRFPINDRVMLHVLRAVQTERSTGQLRRISFREIDVEQIGYIYEGLLGYTTKIAETTVLGLKGKEGVEPEITLEKLSSLIAESTDSDFPVALTAFLKLDQPGAKPPTPAQLKRARTAPVDEAEARRLLLPVCHHDPDLISKLLPLFGLLRTDLRGLPFVIPPGGLLVVETPSRKNAGAHYTPRSLAEEVVKYTLQPLVYAPGPLQTGNEAEWKLVSSAEILDLNVADIAAGSGAFLVAAARYLGEKLVAARAREGSIELDSLDDGAASRIRTSAEREVIAHCLYGADINPMAVEMCKLSLWLVSMDPTKPFSFVDDKVLCGNSLLGLTTADQLRYLHIDPGQKEGKQLALTRDIDGPLRRAAQLRASISQSTVDDDDPQRSATHKAALLRETRQVTAMLRDIADGVVAAGLRLGGNPGKALEDAYDDLSVAVLNAYPEGEEVLDASLLAHIQEAGLTPSVETDFARWQPLHWIIEVPDVMERGGFDAIVGNPPFLGGQKLTGAFGTDMRDWLVNQLADRARGSADLVAYFFLRAFDLLADHRGLMGLIATNTVAQGDTREVGLKRMLGDGFEITRSIQSASWPAASANLEYAAVWGSATEVEVGAPRIADGIPCAKISSLLEPEGRITGDPLRLKENQNVAFQGSIVLGKGFLLTPDEADRLLKLDSRNADVIFPYLNGEDLNSRPDSSASRFVINFHDWSEERAREYPAPFEIVERLVRPERATNARRARREKWWQYAERASGLYRAIKPLDRVIVIAQVSKTLMPALVPSTQVLDAKLVVFAADEMCLLGILSSSIHRLWAVKFGTTMRADATYTPSTLFEPFPRPEWSAELESVANQLVSTRARIMSSRSIGMTPVYNLVNSPDCHSDDSIDELRELHIALDRAVLDAYGWRDIEVKHGFYEYRQVERFTVDPTARIEILDRLLEENRQRAATQADRNAGPVQTRGGRSRVKPRQAGKDLFGEELN